MRNFSFFSFLCNFTFFLKKIKIYSKEFAIIVTYFFSKILIPQRLAYNNNSIIFLILITLSHSNFFISHGVMNLLLFLLFIKKNPSWKLIQNVSNENTDYYLVTEVKTHNVWLLLFMLKWKYSDLSPVHVMHMHVKKYVIWNALLIEG